MQDTPVLSVAWLPERDTNWMDQALCKGDSETFFPPPPKNRSRLEINRYAHDVEVAKAVCAACPVRAACLADAVSRNEKDGIWGGVDFYVSIRERRGVA